jgi:hypothetical protein
MLLFANGIKRKFDVKKIEIFLWQKSQVTVNCSLVFFFAKLVKAKMFAIIK